MCQLRTEENESGVKMVIVRGVPGIFPGRAFVPPGHLACSVNDGGASGQSSPDVSLLRQQDESPYISRGLDSTLPTVVTVSSSAPYRLTQMTVALWCPSLRPDAVMKR